MASERRIPEIVGVPKSVAVAGRLLIIFAPILALLALAALLVLAAATQERYRSELSLGAGIAAATAGLLAMILLYRQIRQRQTATREVRSLEARVSDVVESAMDPIITVDGDQRVVVFNAAAEKVFQWPRSAVLGEPLDKLLPERFRRGHRAHVERFGESGATTRRMGSQMVLMALRANGEEFPIEASISQHTEDNGRLFTVILRDVTARMQAETALRRSKEELQELGAAADVAREQEKNRIARELHDELGQALTMLQMDVAWCKEKLPSAEEVFVRRLDKMTALLVGTVAATRRIAADLRPLLLDDLGLVPAVESLVENFRQRTGVSCELAVSDPDMQLSGAHSTAVFRAVQEALTNVAKHAEAKHVEVAIEQRPTEVIVSICDDGRGFSPQDPRKEGSFGLVGLRERAYLIGGEAIITSATGKGTSIELRLPLRSEQVLS